MKRKYKDSRGLTRCTSQQLLATYDICVERLIRVLLLLLLVPPQWVSGGFKASFSMPSSFQCSPHPGAFANSSVRKVCTAKQLSICVVVHEVSGHVSSFRPLLLSPLCVTPSSLHVPSEELEAGTHESSSCPKGERHEEWSTSSGSLRENRAAYGVSAPVSFRISACTPPRALPVQWCFLRFASLLTSEQRNVAVVGGRFQFFRKWHGLHKAIRGANHHFSVPVFLFSVSAFPPGYRSSSCSPASRESRASPLLPTYRQLFSQPMLHTTRRWSTAKVYRGRLHGRTFLFKCCKSGSDAKGLLHKRLLCAARKVQVSVYPVRSRRYAVQTASHLFNSPRSHGALVESGLHWTATRDDRPRDSARHFPERKRPHASARTKCYLAAKRFTHDVLNDEEDVAARQETEHGEQEAFERLASQVESQLRGVETDDCPGGTWDPPQRQQRSLQREDHWSALQKRGQHKPRAGERPPAADFQSFDGRRRRAANRQGSRDGEKVADNSLLQSTFALQRQQQRNTDLTNLERYSQRPEEFRGAPQERRLFRIRAVETAPQTSRTRKDRLGEDSFITSGLLPLTPSERLQENRSRHLGNASYHARQPSTRLFPPVEKGQGAAEEQIKRDNIEKQNSVKVTLTGAQQLPLERYGKNGNEQGRQTEESGSSGRRKIEGNSDAAPRSEGSAPVVAIRDELPPQDTSQWNKTSTKGDSWWHRKEHGDRRLMHLLLQSNSVCDVWGLLSNENVQLLSGASLVGLIQRLSFLCTSAHQRLPTKQSAGKRSALESRAAQRYGASDEFDTIICNTRQKKLFSTSPPAMQRRLQRQVREEVKKHPIFKDMLNAVREKIHSLRAAEAVSLLHGLATLNVHSAPDLAHRAAALVAMKAFGIGCLPDTTTKAAPPPLELLNHFTLGRLWASLELLATGGYQQQPLQEALTLYTIKRLKAASALKGGNGGGHDSVPQNRNGRAAAGGEGSNSRASFLKLPPKKGEKSAGSGTEEDAARRNTREDEDESHSQNASVTAESYEKEPITPITAAVIARAAVQVHVGSQYPSFVGALQSYILSLLVGTAPITQVSPVEKSDVKPARRQAPPETFLRLILSLANLQKQRAEGPAKAHPSSTLFTLSFAPDAGSPVRKLVGQVNSLHEGSGGSSLQALKRRGSKSKLLHSAVSMTLRSETEEPAEKEEEDRSFLEALGTYLVKRIPTMNPSPEQLSRLVKVLNYFYWSALCRRQQLKPQATTRQMPRRGHNQRSLSLACLPKLVVAAAVIAKQREDSFHDLLGLSDFLVNMNSFLYTSTAWRTAIKNSAITRMAAQQADDETTGRSGARADRQAPEAAALTQKIQENEWERGEEYVQSVLQDMAKTRLHAQLEHLLEELKQMEETRKDQLSKKAEARLDGSFDFGQTPLASKHRALLGRSRDLLSALLALNCTTTGDLLVECVRSLVNFGSVTPVTLPVLTDELIKKDETEAGAGATEKRTSVSAAGGRISSSGRVSEGVDVDNSGEKSADSTSTSAKKDLAETSAEEERVRCRQYLLHGSLLRKVKARDNTHSIRRSISAANSSEELLSAVVSCLNLLQPAAPQLQTHRAAAAPRTESEPKGPGSEDFQAAPETRIDLRNGGDSYPNNPVNDRFFSSALHRLALLQQRQREERGGQANIHSNLSPGDKRRRCVLSDPRMLLLLQAVASKLPTMGPQVTRVLWALQKLHYFDQRNSVGSECRQRLLQASQQRLRPSYDTSLLVAANNAGTQSAAAAPPAFAALREMITLRLLQRVAALIRYGRLTGSEISATLRVLAGINFSTITSKQQPPKIGNSISWGQAVDKALQDVRRSISSGLLHSKESLSGLDASIALYSLATLGWTASASLCGVSPLRRELFLKSDFPTLVPRGAQPASSERNALQSDAFEQHKLAGLRKRAPSYTQPPRGMLKDAKASLDEVNMEDDMTRKESFVFSALVQRLTGTLDTCNVQTLVVALWAVAVTAGRRQHAPALQDTDGDGRHEEHKIVIAPPVAATTAIDTDASQLWEAGSPVQSLDEELEKPLLYEQSVCLTLVEKKFLAAARQKLEKQVSAVGREALSMLLLAALILRWREPALLLHAVHRSLDILRTQSGPGAARARYTAVGSDVEVPGSSATKAFFPARGAVSGEKTGELHSRVWAVLAMLQQQLLSTAGRGSPHSAKALVEQKRSREEASEEMFSPHLSELWKAQRQASVQLIKDLTKALRMSTVKTSAPQHAWTMQQLQSVVLSWMTTEVDRAQLYQELNFQRDSAAQNATSSAASSTIGADDTEQDKQVLFLLVERFARELFIHAAASINTPGALRTQLEREASRQERSNRNSTPLCLAATLSSMAPAVNAAADTLSATTNVEAVSSGKGPRHSGVTEWVKRLSLLLFALRRVRHFICSKSPSQNSLRKTELFSSGSGKNERLLLERKSSPAPHSNSPLEYRGPLQPFNEKIVFSARSLLAGATQLIVALLRVGDLHPRHPQFPSLLLELNELLTESMCVASEGNSDLLSSLGSATRFPDLSEGHIKVKMGSCLFRSEEQEGTEERPMLRSALKKLGQALADWVCLHVDELDDGLYNVVLPLVHRLGTQPHLLSTLRRIALQPVKGTVQALATESDLFASPVFAGNQSVKELSHAGHPHRSTHLHRLNPLETPPAVLAKKEEMIGSQQLMMRKSRAASLALMLHHRHRVSFHPPSMLLSLVHAATEPADLLATVAHDAAHALSTMQRWKAVLGQTRTDLCAGLADAQPSEKNFAPPQQKRTAGQGTSLRQLWPSGAVPRLTAAALHEALCTRSQVLVNGLNRALNLNNASTSKASNPVVNESDTPAEGTSASNSVLPVKPGRKDQFSKHWDGLTQWDVLPLQQLVHASTAAAQLLELPSAAPVWRRTVSTDKKQDAEQAQNISLSSPVMCAATRGRPPTGMQAEKKSAAGLSGARLEPLLLSRRELTAAAAALTRRLLQLRYLYSRAPKAGSSQLTRSLKVEAPCPPSKVPQSIPKQHTTNMKEQHKNLNKSCSGRYTSEQSIFSKTSSADLTRPSPSMKTVDHRIDGGSGSMTLSSLIPFVGGSLQGWRRFRAFLKTRRDWVAAAGALRLLGGGEDPNAVAQILVEIANEIADILETNMDCCEEVPEAHKDRQDIRKILSATRSDETVLELTEIEKELSIDAVSFEEDDAADVITGQSAAAGVDMLAKKSSSGTPPSHRQSFLLLQHLACSYLEEILFQVKHLQNRSTLYRITEDSPTKTLSHESSMRALKVSSERLLRLLASAPVLPVNSAAFLLQPCLVLLNEEMLHGQAVENRQATSFGALRRTDRAEAVSRAEAYIHDVVGTLILRLLPLITVWAPRLNSHRAAALFVELSRSLRCAGHSKGDGPAKDGSRSKILSRPHSVSGEEHHDSTNRKMPELSILAPSEEKSSCGGDDCKLVTSPLRAVLITLQKAILLHAQRSPGSVARFWKALTLQAADLSFLNEKSFLGERQAPTEEDTAMKEDNITAGTFAKQRKRKSSPGDLLGADKLLEGNEQETDGPLNAYRITFDAVFKFADGLAESAVRANNAFLDSNRRKEPTATRRSTSKEFTVLHKTDAILQHTAENSQGTSHSDAAISFPPQSAPVRDLEAADWIYGAVAAAGSGLLGDKAQQCIATAAAHTSPATAAYYAALSFLAHARSAPKAAVAFLSRMLAGAARSHLSAIVRGAAPQASVASDVVSCPVNKASSGRRMPLRGEKKAQNCFSPVEASDKETPTAGAFQEKQDKGEQSTRLVKAAWLAWLGTSLQQARQGEREKMLPPGYASRNNIVLLESAEKQEIFFMKVSKQVLEEVVDCLCNLLQDETLRLTEAAKSSLFFAECCADRSVGVSVSAKFYALLILVLETVIKLHPEDGKDIIKLYSDEGEDKNTLHRLSRIKAILSAFTLVVDAAISAFPKTLFCNKLSCGNSHFFLSIPSLQSIAYILHLARKARVYHAPLVTAITHAIRLHRHKLFPKEAGLTILDGPSQSSRDSPMRAGLPGAHFTCDETCTDFPRSGATGVDLWPSLTLLADAATYLPQEALTLLKKELLLFVDPLVQTAPLCHLVRVLRFFISATPVGDMVSSSGKSKDTTKKCTTIDKLEAVTVGSYLCAGSGAEEEGKRRSIQDRVVRRCVIEGRLLFDGSRTNSKDWFGAFAEQLVTLEEIGYAPVGLIDTLNKVELLRMLSAASNRVIETPKKKRQGTSDDGPPWSRLLPLAVKHYTSKGPSTLHKVVSSILISTLHLPHRNEVWTPTGLSLDIALNQRAADGRPIAVEVDGPTHYVTALGPSVATEREQGKAVGGYDNGELASCQRWQEMPTALTQFKRQLLQQTGWHVVSVPFFSWTLPSHVLPQIPTFERKKVAEIEQQLQRHPQPAMPAVPMLASRQSAVQQRRLVLLLAEKLNQLLTDPPFNIDSLNAPEEF